MKRKWLWIAMVLILVILVGASVWRNSKDGVISYVEQNLDRLQAHAVGCIADPEAHTVFKDWDTAYETWCDAVVFRVSYGGFGSQSDEKGFYYVTDGQPRTFGCEEGRQTEGNAVRFLGEGDNSVLTEQIAPGWFWYEQHW